MATPTVIGNHIRDCRKKLRYSQRELAEKVSISDAEICRIENGTRVHPSREVLRELAAALNVPVSELFEKAGYIDTDSIAAVEAMKENPNDYIFVGDLSPSEIEDVKKYIAFIKAQRQ